jgi:RNA polymerase primary sigma factor
LQHAVADGHSAAERFVMANLRLVVSVARRYQSSAVPLGDLIQEGNVGLIRAVERFDDRKGFRFSTYATWWIRQTISRAASNHAPLGNLGGAAGDDLASVRRSIPRLEQQLQRPPSNSEVAAALAMTPERLRRLVAYSMAPLSLDEPLGADTANKLSDVVAVGAADEAIAAVAACEIRDSLAAVDRRERQVLTLRYGLDRGHGRSLSEVGEQLGLSGERIRQLESRALCKLRHPSARFGRLDGLLAG